MRTQRVSAGQNRQVLEDDRVEQRCHQLVGRRAFFLQTVDIGLSEDTALPRHFVQLDSEKTLLAQFGRGNLQLRVDLVDDCAGTAGAFVIHRWNLLLPAGFRVRFEDDDLGVLTAELDDRVHLRMQFFHGQRHRRDFLHELGANQRRDVPAARSGDEHPAVFLTYRQIGFEATEKFQRLFRLLGFVPLIVRPDDLIGRRVHRDRLDRR